MSSPVQVRVLGPVEVVLGDRLVDLGSPKQRALVAALALTPGRAVSVDALVDLLWGAGPPPGVTGTLQGYVSGLRRVVEPDREPRTPPSVLVTVAPGYALQLPAEAVDAVRFETMVAAEHRRLLAPLLGPPRLAADELARAAQELDAALALWRGQPFAEIGDAAAGVAQRAHLEELRLVASEDRATARLGLGDHATAAAELAVLTAAHPLRERLWALRILALFRSGRQAEALDVVEQVRALLADELGLDPGPELRELQDLVLRQDPALAWVAPRQAAVTAQEPGGATGPVRATQAGPVPPVAPVTAGWPLVGRDAELGGLLDLLSTAGEGRARFAVITGEPGIGKSRLCAELCAYAEARGSRVAVGRCSQDEGAPPLWPWTAILARLGVQLPEVAETDRGDFRLWESITRAVRAAAVGRDSPLVLVLDDLHWADTATLRVLRLLVDTADDDPLLVVTTWRDRPRPQGALADTAESLARRHATRVELTGLDPSAVAGIVVVVTRQRPTQHQATTLLRRTDGNPFFLVEYARLVGSGTDLDQLLREPDPPTAVQEVLDRRLDRLPPATVAALRTGAVLGREFDAATLAAVLRVDEDELLEVVEPAQASGLLREEEVGRFGFAHALVRDTLYGGLTPTRRARQHARVAEQLARAPGRETEVARHYLASGPAYAALAWRSAVAAAPVALRVHAHAEAVSLYRAALAAMDQDQQATGRDRYGVLTGLAAAYRRAVMWPELVCTIEAAVATAEALDEPILAAEAAVMTAHGALWQPAAHGQVHTGIVAALRRSLAAIPDQDSRLRCRCLVSLATELYYAAAYQERRALVDEAVAMARRLDDPTLQLAVHQSAFLSIWAPDTAEERLALTEQALSLARHLGDEEAEVMTATLQAMVLTELGRTDELWQLYGQTRRRAEELRHVYSLIVLDSMMIAWHALAGRFDECDRLLANVLTLASHASLQHVDDAVRGNLAVLGLWRGEDIASDEAVADFEATAFPTASLIGMLLWRGGREDDARAYVASHDIDLTGSDWFSMLNWCYAGAVAAYVGDPQLGARVCALIAPYAGRSCTAGSGVASGPVDAYLALAVLAAGERELASRHADEAERLAEEWRIPLFAQWLRGQRDRFGF